MKRIVSPVAAAVAGLWLSSAAALGLGEIEVHSRLNQRFDAVIPLNSVTADEAASLRVALAGADDFSRAGIERADYLSSLHFAVKTDGTPRIEISSAQIEREPYMQLLLEIRSGGSRILRQYTVLLDPPDYAAPVPAAPAPRPAAAASAPAPVAEEAPAPVFEEVQHPAPPPDEVREPAPRPAATPSVSPASAIDTPVAGELYGPVKPGETLWSIATRMRPGAGVTMDQALLAVYNSNPRAFDGGINGLLTGAMLRVPSESDMTAVDAADAKAQVARLRGLPAGAARTAPQRPRKPIIEPAQIAPPPPADRLASSEPTPAPAPAAPAPAEPEPAPPPAAAEQAPASGDEAAPAQATAPAEAPPAGAATETAPPAEEAAPPPERKPAPAPSPAGDESGGLLETLLIPLIGGLLVLGGIGWLFSQWRKRRAPPPLPAVAPRAPQKMPLRSPASEMAVAGAAAAGSLAATQKLTPQQELDRLQQTLDQPPHEEKTQQVDVAVQPDPESVHVKVAPPPDLPPVDFDLTGQFATQTVQIDLDANDPLSEADFHLAYGLYDEAALLLKQAAEKQPERTDLLVKLAETYFAAGKTAEFAETAGLLKARLPAAEWQKIAIMGQQLDPDAAQYRDAAPVPMATDLDLGGDASPGGGKATLDFKLDDLELPSLDAARAEEPILSKEQVVEFDLGGFDVQAPAAAAAAPATQAPVASDPGASVDFDLGEFDAPAASPAPAAPAPAAEVALDEFDFDSMTGGAADISGDEAGTKLDLARAYVDMGDNEMARSLLAEVLEQGNETQKQEAQSLIGRLG